MPKHGDRESTVDADDLQGSKCLHTGVDQESPLRNISCKGRGERLKTAGLKRKKAKGK